MIRLMLAILRSAFSLRETTIIDYDTAEIIERNRSDATAIRSDWGNVIEWGVTQPDENSHEQR